MTPQERADTIAGLEKGIEERRLVLSRNPTYQKREQLEAQIIGLSAEANALRQKVQH